MAKKKSKSFSKHVYALVAIIVLLVSAGIASYAAAPAGSATHGTLYTDRIYNKSVNRIEVFAPTSFWQGIGGFNGGLLGSGGIMGDPAQGVYGQNAGGSNVGKLGTATAGVEGTSNLGYGLYGQSTNAGGVMGVSTGGYGVTGTSTNSQGVVGSTASSSFFGGQFFGGRGLYASKIEFGPDAFNYANNQGLLILGIRGGVTLSCTNVCASHGLGCIDGIGLSGTSVGCGSSGIQRYCWCD